MERVVGSTARLSVSGCLGPFVPRRGNGSRERQQITREATLLTASQPWPLPPHVASSRSAPGRLDTRPHKESGPDHRSGPVALMRWDACRGWRPSLHESDAYVHACSCESPSLGCRLIEQTAEGQSSNIASALPCSTSHATASATHWERSLTRAQTLGLRRRASTMTADFLTLGIKHKRSYARATSSSNETPQSAG